MTYKGSFQKHWRNRADDSGVQEFTLFLTLTRLNSLGPGDSESTVLQTCTLSSHLIRAADSPVLERKCPYLSGVHDTGVLTAVWHEATEAELSVLR